MQRCPPETWGLTAAFCMVVLLRLGGASVQPKWATSKAGGQAFAEIEREWPMLKTADTLLAGQSFLRPLAIISALFRAGCLRRAGHEGAVVALAAEPTALLALSIIARTVAFPLCGNDDYLLHGPAGGMLPIAFDVFCLTMLFCLYISHTQPCRRMVLFAALAYAAALTAKNDLGIATQGQAWVANKAFALSCVFEVMATLAHLVHVVVGPVTSGVGAVTAIFATSQFLAAYYFIHVFPPGGEMSPMANGFGTEIITGGTVVQFGLSLLAIAVHVARSSDGPQESPASSPQKQKRKRLPKTSADDAPMARMEKPADDESSESPVAERDEPQLLKLAAGVPQYCCAPHACLARPCGSMYTGEEVLEVRCSAGCCSAVHARCFRAATRAVRQRCALPGCDGRVVRFGAISELLEAAPESD